MFSLSRKRRLFLVLASAVFVTACKEVKLESRFRDRHIKIDGAYADWEGALTPLEGEQASVGLLNDDDFLYICLVTDNPQVRRQVVGQGLILWFDPTGGEEKKFGVRYPIGMLELGMPMGGREGGAGVDRRSEALKALRQEVEILGPEKDQRRRMRVIEARGIQADIGWVDGRLVYELKMPLSRDPDRTIGIGTRAGQTIAIGLETPEIDRQRLRERMRGGRRGQRPGGFPGGGGGMQGRRFEPPELLKIWAIVQLARG